MKKLFLVLMLSVMVGACGESATDVATRHGGGGGGGDPFIPPDTVIKAEHATLNGYRPGNPVAIETAQGLTARASFNNAVATAAALGYGFDPAAVAVVSGRTDDGREVHFVLGSLLGGEGDGFAIYMRVGEWEKSLPLRLSDREPTGYEVLEDVDKLDPGPQSKPWYYGDLLNCLQYVVADLMACRSSCTWCGALCDLRALLNLVVCVVFFMM